MKVCGLRQPEHVEAAVAAGVDAIGFVMTASVRRVGNEEVGGLLRLVPPEILTVAVFAGEAPEVMRAAVEETGIRAVQLHGAHPARDFQALADLPVTLIRAVPFDEAEPMSCGAFGEKLLIIDAPRPGSGEAWEWAGVGERVTGEWMLAGGLHPGNVREAIAAARPWGVDVSSGVELRRGEKDSELIRRFVASARMPSPTAGG